RGASHSPKGMSVLDASPLRSGAASPDSFWGLRLFVLGRYASPFWAATPLRSGLRLLVLAASLHRSVFFVTTAVVVGPGRLNDDRRSQVGEKAWWIVAAAFQVQHQPT